MNITIKEERENMLFRRKEVNIELETDVTPSREDAKKIVCESISCSPEVVRIIKIDSKFGENIFTIVAEVYNSKEDAREYSPIFKKKDIEAEKKEFESKKKALEEAKKVEEVPKEEPVEEHIEESKKESEGEKSNG